MEVYDYTSKYQNKETHFQIEIEMSKFSVYKVVKEDGAWADGINFPPGLEKQNKTKRHLTKRDFVLFCLFYVCFIYDIHLSFMVQ